MQYKGYTITAEVTMTEEWTLGEDGELDDKAANPETFEISGYWLYFANREPEYISSRKLKVDEIHRLVDEHIKAHIELDAGAA